MLGVMKPVVVIVSAAAGLLLILQLLTLVGLIAAPPWLPGVEKVAAAAGFSAAIVGIWKYVKWGPGPYRH